MFEQNEQKCSAPAIHFRFSFHVGSMIHDRDSAAALDPDQLSNTGVFLTTAIREEQSRKRNVQTVTVHKQRPWKIVAHGNGVTQRKDLVLF